MSRVQMKSLIGVVLLSISAFGQTGTNSPFNGSATRNRTPDRSSIEVSQLVLDIYHLMSLIANSLRRQPPTEQRIATDLQQFDAMPATDPAVRQYTPCVAKFKAAYPHLLKAADLFAEHSRLRNKASSATLNAILKQENEEHKIGADLLTAGAKCLEGKGGAQRFLQNVVAGVGMNAAALDRCLETIQSTAAADPSSPVNRLLNGLAPVPVTVGPRAPRDTSNATAYSAPGKPVSISWSPTDRGRYTDGAAKLPCATLLHELTHAWENYNGYDSGELQAVRAENWLIWKLGAPGGQRGTYNGTRLPPGQVIWPQAAAPRSP